MRRSRLGRLRAQPRPHLRRKLSPACAFETPRPEQGIGYYCLAACRAMLVSVEWSRHIYPGAQRGESLRIIGGAVKDEFDYRPGGG